MPLHERKKKLKLIFGSKLKGLLKRGRKSCRAKRYVGTCIKLGTPNLNASKVLNWNSLFDKLNPDVQTSTKSLTDPVGGACLIDPIEKVKAWNGSLF